MECFSDISFCVWGPILDGGSKIDKLGAVMETLEPVRNGTPEVSALCSAGISTGLERSRRGTEFTESNEKNDKNRVTVRRPIKQHSFYEFGIDSIETMRRRTIGDQVRISVRRGQLLHLLAETIVLKSIVFDTVASFPLL